MNWEFKQGIIVPQQSPTHHQVKSNWRWLPLVIILCLMIAAYALGLHERLTLEEIAKHRDGLKQIVADNLALALLTFVVAYICAVALSLPGATLFTVAGGLMFGWALGATASVLAATAGATLIFLAAKTSMQNVLARKAGPILSSIQAGFARDAFNYMLFLRLVPLFPFWLVNIAAALAHVRLRIYVIATIIGVIPATIAFSFVGAGLDSVIEAQKSTYDACVSANGSDNCRFELSLSSVITPQLLFAFAALGVVALIPVVFKKLRAKP